MRGERREIFSVLFETRIRIEVTRNGGRAEKEARARILNGNNVRFIST